MRIKNDDERLFYEIEATSGNWSVRELQRQYGSSLYERLALSRDKEQVARLSRVGNVVEKPEDIIKNPVTLEFVKPYTRVRFLFNYSFAAEGVKVTSPSFKPTTDGAKIARKGTFKVTYPLTGTATSESYTVTKNGSPAEGEELVAFTEEYIPEGTEKWYIVLPVLSQGSYTMSVSVNGTAKTAVVPAEYMSWKPGYSYTYIFKITEEGGVEIDLVQVAVTTWTDMSIVHSVYNW